MTTANPAPGATPPHQAARDALVERIAPRLSHDLNNQIQGVLGFAELAADALAPGSPERNSLERVMQSGERAAAMLHALTEYRHVNTRAARPLDLPELASRALALFGDAGARGLAVATAFEPGLPRVMGCPEHWIGALLAVLTAAEDAGQSTRLEIRGRQVAGDPLPVELSVRFSGKGPLTEPGGLPDGESYGLWLALDVAAAGGGRWTASFTPATGTEYAWRMPAAAEPGGESVAARGRNALLVESDPVVSEMLLRVLFQLGLTVGLRRDAAEASGELGATLAAGLGLAVLDWNTPGAMPVSVLFERLRAQSPALPVLILTDFAWLEDELELPPGVRVRILPKPVAPRDLIMAIEVLLS